MAALGLAVAAGASGCGSGGATNTQGPGALAYLRHTFAPNSGSDVGVNDGGNGAYREKGGPPELKFVERTLRRRGLRFGTDGTFGGLLSYFEHGAGSLVPPTDARRGDVVFFDIGGRRCADHAGLVESVDARGRITFREWRGGSVRLSYVHPSDPSARRSPEGRILNSFLRPRLPDDPPAARYFAGEMLCAVGRARR